VAEVIVEPVMSGVGVAVPPDEYLPEVESLCRKYGILLHVDEVINGFASNLSSAAEEFADRLGDDGVRQDDRHIEHGEGVAVPLGKADAVEQHCLGAFRLKPLAGREYRLPARRYTG
jgi:hypothetical protein